MWQSNILKSGIHVFVGGQGQPVVLLPGWPQTAEAFLEIFWQLAAKYQVWAVDPPGIGDSQPSTDGYDTGTISSVLEDSIRSVTSSAYHLVGHDVGGWIAYAWAAQFPQRVKSLTILDAAIPGNLPSLSYPLSDQANIKLWQFTFNRLPDLPETLTRGRERELLDWLFDSKSQYPSRITSLKRKRYVECYSGPNKMRYGFEYYRSFTTSATQNNEFAKRKLQMPVLALGGENAVGEGVKNSLEGLAETVEGGTILSCGHYVMEEQPEDVARQLCDFFGRVDQS